jgi:hypothetical protein
MIIYVFLQVILLLKLGVGNVKLFKEVTNVFNKLMNFTWWIRFFAEASLFISIAALSEIYGNAKDIGSPESYTFALFTMLVILAGLIFMPFHLFLFNSSPAISTGLFSALYQGIKPNALARLNMFLFVLRWIGIACVIVFMHNEDYEVQIFHFFEIQVLAIAYQILVMPHISLFDNIIAIWNEFVLILAASLMVNSDGENFLSYHALVGLLTIMIFNLLSVSSMIIGKSVFELLKKSTGITKYFRAWRNKQFRKSNYNVEDPKKGEAKQKKKGKLSHELDENSQQIYGTNTYLETNNNAYLDTEVPLYRASIPFSIPLSIGKPDKRRPG